MLLSGFWVRQLLGTWRMDKSLIDRIAEFKIIGYYFKTIQFHPSWLFRYFCLGFCLLFSLVSLMIHLFETF